MNLIILTQACDLENNKVEFAALCPIYTLSELTLQDKKYGKREIRNEIRKGRVEGLHMLGSPTQPTDNLASLIADFHQIYSLPVSYLRSHADQLGDRWRLSSPYLEHFSQAFARFFMRVGLPSDIEKF